MSDMWRRRLLSARMSHLKENVAPTLRVRQLHEHVGDQWHTQCLAGTQLDWGLKDTSCA